MIEEISKEDCCGAAGAVPGISSHRLHDLLANTKWYEHIFNNRSCTVEYLAVREGSSVVADDTDLAKRGESPAGAALR